MTVRVRYAPSPTGHLHIGGARTALFNYLFAKHHQGTFLLRIEDTDLERHVEGAAKEMADNLHWLGITWDEGVMVGGEYGPYYCTERLPIYQQYQEQLLATGHAYPCYCSDEELQIERDLAMQEGRMPQYSGKCRHLRAEQIAQYEAEGRKPALRFRVAHEEPIEFTDLIRGDMRFEEGSFGGDFVIVKSNGIPTYNFACTVDDHLMAITHVIRGEEHLSNTPRQILIYRALGFSLPVFGHVSLILGANGKKLSKRDESIVQFIDQYREMGYLPEAIFNFLALLGFAPQGEEEILTKEQLIEQFTFDRVNKSGAFFDAVKLDWLNAHYLKAQDSASLLPIMEKILSPYVKTRPYLADASFVIELIALYQEQVSHLAQIVTQGKTFFEEKAPYEQDALALLKEGDHRAVIESFEQGISSLEDFTAPSIKALLQTVQKETGKKGKDLFMPIRAAVTGQLHGRDLPRSVTLLGRERVLFRLKESMEFLS